MTVDRTWIVDENQALGSAIANELWAQACSLTATEHLSSNSHCCELHTEMLLLFPHHRLPNLASGCEIDAASHNRNVQGGGKGAVRVTVRPTSEAPCNQGFEAKF
jgi:hypothetical protein